VNPETGLTHAEVDTRHAAIRAVAGFAIGEGLMTTALYWGVPLPALERRCQAEMTTETRGAS